MEEVTLKFLTIGDASVGKTCIMLRFADDDFPTSTMPTIGVEYKARTLTIEDRPVKLQVWDTAGQERYHKTISSTFYRRADAIILVFDSSDRTTFEHVRTWMDQIQQRADKNATVAIVGNKSDIPRKVEIDEAEALASFYDVPFFSVSAKTGSNVQEMFEQLARNCLHKRPVSRAPKENEFVIPKVPERPQQDRNCC